MQWLTLWLAGYRRNPLWHALAKAVALRAVLDDVVVPPPDLAWHRRAASTPSRRTSVSRTYCARASSA
ncbi:hypothetical protein [Streptomyces acidiscabies]|uniref:hypothetical protein n=1 Tax=Streptomyces acidiscabies TaxID=42234 RepID=UPI0038F7926D